MLHYWRFIQSYAKLAHPLYALTKKGVQFQWTAECKIAFETLKYKLLIPPGLVYPNFSRDFVLETDTSKPDLGAILICHSASKTINYTPWLMEADQYQTVKLIMPLSIWRY